MADFDLKQYLLARQTSGVGSKLDAIDAAYNEKAAEIGQASEGKKSEIAGQSKPWVDVLGLRHSPVGNLVNLGASMVSGAGRVVGDIASLPADAMASGMERQVNPAQFEAYNRIANGKAMPGDEQLLKAPFNPLDPNGRTVLDQIKEAQGFRGTAGKIDNALDFNSIVDKRAQNRMTKQLEAGFNDPWEQVKKGWEQLNGDQKISGGADVAVGLAKLLYRAGEAGVTNPQATAEYITENLPQLGIGALGAVGKAGMLSSNLGYAAENYRKGLDNYAKQNNGAYPPEDVRKTMAMAAAGTALAEQAGDMFSLAKIGKGIKPAVDAVEKAGEKVLRGNFKEALLATAQGTASEAATEGVQTYLEGVAQLKPASASDIYVGATIGGLAGGGLTGGGRALASAAEGAAGQLEQAATKEAAKTAAKLAADNGKVEVFTDPKSPLYAPDKAVAALQQASLKEGATVEQVKANFDQAVEQLSLLDAKDADLAKQMAALPKDDKAGRKALQEERDSLAKISDSAVKTVMAFQADLAKMQESTVATKDLVAQVNTAVDPTDTAALAKKQDSAQQILVRAMTAPDSVSAEELLSVVNNPGNGLSDAQRMAFRQLSDAQVAANKLMNSNDVRQEIYFGNEAKKQVGIATYMKRAAMAVTTGNTGMGVRQVAGLSKFIQSHEGKAQAVVQALQKAKASKDPRGYAVLRTEDGKWEVKPIPAKSSLEKANNFISRNGGLRIHQGSGSVVQSITEEMGALKKAKVAMEGVLSLSSSQTAPAESSATPSVEAPAAPVEATTPATTEQPQAAQVSEPVAAAPAEPTVQETVQGASEEPSLSSQAVVELKPTGKLSAIVNSAADKAKLAGTKINAVWRDLNLASVFLAQREQRAENGSKLPLVANADFLSAWAGDNKLMLEYLPKSVIEALRQKGTELVDQKRTAILSALKNAGVTLTEWVKALEGQMPTAAAYDRLDPDFRHRDVLHFLAKQEDGSLAWSENTLTAIAYSAYQWALDEANSPAKKKDKQLSEMHSREEQDYPTKAGRKALQGVAGFEDPIINSLGQAAVQALGLKAEKAAPKDLMARLQNDLGAHALALLQKQGLVTLETHKASTVNTVFFKNTPAITSRFGENVTFTYVKLTREAGKVEEIKAANKFSAGAVDKLFGAEKAPRIAEAGVKQKFTQEFAQGTRQQVPQKLVTVLKASQEVPHKVIPEMLKLAMALGKQSVLTAAGFVDLSKTALHRANEDSAEAQNDNLSNQYDLMMEMLGVTIDLLPQDFQAVLDQEFFIQHSVWKNYRVGVDTQSLNQQSSKIHRFMFSRPNWQATIALDNQALVDEFKVSVAQALGAKIDKQPNAQTLQDKDVLSIFEDKDSKWQKAAAAVRAGVLEGDTWTEEGRALVAELSAQNEGMMTLQGLVALGKYQQAVDTGAKSFDVTLLVGADGKTNGPILTHLALGAGTSKDDLFAMLNRGGMYSTQDETEHYSQFAAKGGLDLYQVLAGNVLKKVFAQHRENPALNALQVITKDLVKGNQITGAARNLMKTPMTSFAFGSALSKSVGNMQQSFVEGIYTAIEELANGVRPELGTTADPSNLVRVINTLLREGGSKEFFPENTSIDTLLDTEFTYKQLDALEGVFMRLMGDTVAETMETDFAVFIARRRALNKSIESSFLIYEAAYAEAKQKLIDSLMESGEMASRTDKNGNLVALHGLSQAQEEQLRKSLGDLAPVMHTDFSMNESNLEAGLFMAKTEKQLSDDPLSLSQTQFLNTDARKKSNAKQAKGMESVEVSPGAAGTPYAIHSSDSANMHKSLAEDKQSQALNVHDETSTGVHRIAAAAKAINQTTVDTFLHYSPAAEARNMMERQLVALANLVKEGKLSADLVRQVQKTLTEAYNDDKRKGERISPAEVLDRVAEDAAYLAFLADDLRLQVYADMKVMDQYTWEGGQYQVSPEIREQAKKMQAELRVGMSEEAATALTTLEQLLASTPAKQAQAKGMPWEGSDIDDAPEVETVEQLQALGIRGPWLVAQSPAVPASVKDAVAKGDTVVEAVNALPEQDRATAIQAVAQAANEIPPWEVSPFGELGGSSSTRHHAGLVEFLAAKKEVGTEEMVAYLKKMFQGSAQNAPMVSLMNRLVALAPADLKVVYVTPDMRLDAVDAKPELSNSRGWWTVDGDRNRIYILSTDFKDSAVHAEVIVHELLHAVLSSNIDHPKTLAARALVTELEDVLIQVRKHPSIDKFGNAGLDVHELISWGMTNRKFQTEVLATIQMPEHKNSKNKLINGMQTFIKALRAFFFRDLPVANQDKVTNALTILLTNTAGMFEAVAQDNAKRQQQGPQVRSQQAPGKQSPAMWYTTEQIFDALGTGQKTLSQEFEGKLRLALQTITSRVQGAWGVLAANQVGTVAMTPHDVWMKAQATGEAPFVSKITPVMNVSDKEAFVIEQVEATLRASLSDEASTGLNYKALAQLYEEARRRLKPSDFPSQALYDFVFKMEQDGTKRSDYLTRFAALGLGHQEVNQALSLGAELYTDKPGYSKPDSMADRLVSWFQRALAWMSGQYTHNVPGEKINTRLAKLASQLADIEAKKRAKLARGPLLERFVGDKDMLAGGVAAVRKGASKVAESSFVQNNWFKPVQLAGALANVVLKEQADRVVDKALELRDLATKERFGIAAGLVNTVKGPNEVFQFLLRGMKKLEKTRQDITVDVAKILRDSYGTEPGATTKSAISAVLLRTGAHVLLGSTTSIPDRETGSTNQGQPLDMKAFQALLDDPAVLEKAIRTRIAVLNQRPDLVNYYVYQAKNLAYLKVTGFQKSPLGMLNAGNIARLHGTQQAGSVSEQVAAQVEGVIDELASLYGLEYSFQDQKDLVREVLRQENARTDGNGVEMTLRMHRRLESESRQQLFTGNSTQQMKGYVSEIYNPNTALCVARDEEEKQVLREHGYGEVTQVPLDPNDPDRRIPTLFVLKDGGQMPYMTAATAITGMAAKGTVRYGGMSNAFEEGVKNTEQANALSSIRELQSDRMFNVGPGYDPRNVDKSYLTPVLNDRGEVAAWRYMMSERLKDEVLERDHRFDQVLGAMAGSIFDKVNSVDQNRAVVKALYEVYRREFASRPQSFVRIAHDSPNSEDREMYRLLPDSMQATIREIWGPNGMMVPQELMDITFGYRKLSVTKAFDKVSAQREAERLGRSVQGKDQTNAVENALVKMTEGALYAWARAQGSDEQAALTFSRTAGVKMRRGERAIQEIVREIKDTIVVRGISTMIGNMKSNLSLLLIHGVNPLDLAHHHWIAIKGATDYRSDRAELANLRLQLQTGYTRGREDEINRRIAELEDSLIRNPVRELIDAGLMPTIVEDVGEDDDLYSYKAEFTKKVDSLVSGLNPNVREVGKWIYMTHDTPIYQSLSHITQLSDFVARYTLYQHVTSRKKNPLSKAEAVQLASESFVNYDIPMHRGLQYLDDMGITMFSKYFYYIQRVLLKLGKDRPVQMLMAAALHQYFGRMDLVTESSAVYRLGNNPFHLGPLGVLSSAGQLPAVQVGMGMLD